MSKTTNLEIPAEEPKRDTLHENAQQWWRQMDMESRVAITTAWKFKTDSIYGKLSFLSIDMNSNAIERIYRETQLGEDLF